MSDAAQCLRHYWCRLEPGHREVECLPKDDNWRVWFPDIEREIIEATKRKHPDYTGPISATATQEEET